MASNNSLQPAPASPNTVNTSISVSLRYCFTWELRQVMNLRLFGSRTIFMKDSLVHTCLIASGQLLRSGGCPSLGRFANGILPIIAVNTTATLQQLAHGYLRPYAVRTILGHSVAVCNRPDWLERRRSCLCSA